MNLNGLVLNLSPSGLCVHLVVELQPAAERKPCCKSPHRQSSLEKSLRVQKKMQTCPPKRPTKNPQTIPQTRVEK